MAVVSSADSGSSPVLNLTGLKHLSSMRKFSSPRLSKKKQPNAEESCAFLTPWFQKNSSIQELIEVITQKRSQEEHVEAFEKVLARYLAQIKALDLAAHYFKTAQFPSSFLQVFFQQTIQERTIIPILNEGITSEVKGVKEVNELRGNPFFTQLCTLYFQQELASSLKVIRKLMQKEIKKLAPLFEEGERKSLANSRDFTEFCEQILDRVYCLKIPEHLCELMVTTYQLVQLKFPDEALRHAGNMVMLRVVNPFITDPNIFKNVFECEVAVLVSKTLQNISNHSFYGEKEEDMKLLNQVMWKYTRAHTNFVRRCLKPTEGSQLDEK